MCSVSLLSLLAKIMLNVLVEVSYMDTLWSHLSPQSEPSLFLSYHEWVCGIYEVNKGCSFTLIRNHKVPQMHHPTDIILQLLKIPHDHG